MPAVYKAEAVVYLETEAAVPARKELEMEPKIKIVLDSEGGVSKILTRGTVDVTVCDEHGITAAYTTADFPERGDDDSLPHIILQSPQANQR
ncbi:MAG TPA: hypothetical protein QF813_08585 [Alphaproteobacteria bacterium]|jgi:hypothetical protein|nr:hypothetical protein [Alphaproteobacteria bacterium]|tara:strand:- start:812 stop:1087 length:276 start_codon:yes stop_codon:yes gene_type:complete